ncbi:MAG: 1-acyl-sn-glycerol-3-phosphate acyltransferase [Caldilineaceae bacterium]|nr:1-acyl-sn-glycerol-3-phosphate acyltransferase [Caldilineaceae bacterium]
MRIGWALCHILFQVTIEGAEHAPRRPNGLLVISNHFSWFDAPIISLLLPYPPAYLIAMEAIDHPWFRPLIITFESIPIWRGQVDRQAMTTAVHRLRSGEIVGIFPEGGINPELSDTVAKGQQIAELQGNMSRKDSALIQAKPGVALLATMSGVPVLPVALIGSQHILDNLRRWRRTPLTLRIGPAFGPLVIDATRKGTARRQEINNITDEMLRHVARLLPPEQRGYYADVDRIGRTS